MCSKLAVVVVTFDLVLHLHKKISSKFSKSANERESNCRAALSIRLSLSLSTWLWCISHKFDRFALINVAIGLEYCPLSCWAWSGLCSENWNCEELRKGKKLKTVIAERGENGTKIAQLLNISNTSKPWLSWGVPLKKRGEERKKQPNCLELLASWDPCQICHTFPW